MNLWLKYVYRNKIFVYAVSSSFLEDDDEYDVSNEFDVPAHMQQSRYNNTMNTPTAR